MLLRLPELNFSDDKANKPAAIQDIRALPVPPKPLFTTAELAALAETFRKAGFGRHQRLAVLYRSDPHRGARRFAFISRMKGWRMRAFGEFEDALLWPSEEQAGRAERKGRAVPIQFGERGPKTTGILNWTKRRR